MKLLEHARRVCKNRNKIIQQGYIMIMRVKNYKYDNNFTIYCSMYIFAHTELHQWKRVGPTCFIQVEDTLKVLQHLYP